MPRPLINATNKNKFSESNILSTNKKTTGNGTLLNQKQIDDYLRKKRSKKYIEAMSKLDAGGHIHDKSKVDEIIQAIREEFPEVEITEIMLGCVSKCYLGLPYEVHTLSIADLSIIEHYKIGQPLPGQLERARVLAKRGGYSFIEVYETCCRAIDGHGNVSVIPF